MVNALHFPLLLSFALLLLPSPRLSLGTSPPQQGPETPITRYQQYLRFNTAHPNPNYTAPVSFLTSLAQSLGLKTQTLEFTSNKPTLLITWQGSNPSLPSLLFNSHLDSVPAEPSKWTHPPFSATLTPEGKIFARGAQDDKCIAIQYLEAIRNLKARNFVPTRTLHISFVPDEEIGGIDGAGKFVKSKVFKDLDVGFVLDEGLASGNDEFRVFYADRSPWNVIIKAKGVPGHGSRMYDNGAIENLMDSIEVINRFRDSQFDLVKAGKAANSEVISVNPVFLKAGIPSPTGFVMNMQPSEAEAGFDLRLPPTADPDPMKKRIAEEWAPAVRNMTYEIKHDFSTCHALSWIQALKWNAHSSGLQIIEKGPLRDYMGRPLMTATDDSNPWWSVFKQAIAAAGGKLAKPEILRSTTDARFMRQLGIPTFGFSPMTNTPILSHDHNEFLKDTIFLKGIEVYEHIIHGLSSFEEANSI
ncbi:aminoacylase-1-like [Populus alba x Populus x berolinensis]|uniref:N-acyl-aliphatic-L-amino acid amidohydrolase n=1 Tax=Populus alba x Populus x berolinensis TaxID=444605 RepID=A0AAD6RDC4_9ROSI|nr:aminoacylase-1-like [Populus alba x Populus x berolinensis]